MSKAMSSFIFYFRQTPPNSNVWQEEFEDMKIDYLFYYIVETV